MMLHGKDKLKKWNPSRYGHLMMELPLIQIVDDWLNLLKIKFRGARLLCCSAALCCGIRRAPVQNLHLLLIECGMKYEDAVQFI